MKFDSWVSFENLSIQFVDTICRYNFSIQFVDTICRYNLSTQFVDTICRYNLSIQFVDTICRYNTHFIKFWQELLVLYLTTKISFSILSASDLSDLLGIRNGLEKLVEKTKTHILWSIIFLSKNRAFWEIMWKKFVQPERLTTWCMRVACWINKRQ